MANTLIVVQIVLGVLLSGAILLQNRGSGLGGAWGGTGTSYHTKRGFEKLLSRATVGLAVLFFASSIATISFTG